MDLGEQNPPLGSPELDPSDQRRLHPFAPTILVVDDDGDIREAMADLLRDNGYAPIEVENGQKAHDYLLRHPAPACLILDLWMPELDGLSLASEILHGQLPRVPIILVTAGSSDVGYPVPARYVLHKPLDPDRLLTLVAELAAPRRR
jgi:CheY-like chemotaxis protein